MFDPVTITTALGVASSAMTQIKRMYDHGKDISEMSGQIGKWMNAYAEVDALEKEAKNPSFLRKMTSGKSIEEVALQAFEGRKKLEQDRYELKMMLSFRYGPASWNQLLELEGKIRKQVRDEKIARLKFRDKVITYVALVVVVIIGCGILYYFTYGLVLLDRGELG
tara:strand:- start:586 stop:1083 length:498 start_codon:yes stop_codon:yes gene_type:complete